MAVYYDWDCRLLPSTGELISNPAESAESLIFLKEKFGIRQVFLMPTFEAEQKSIPLFLLHRERAVQSICSLLPSDIRIHAAAASLLTPGLLGERSLGKLRIPQTEYLPIRLPFLYDWNEVMTTLNQLLYRSPYRLLFMEFDALIDFYPRGEIQRWCCLSNVAYCFRYQSLENPKIREILKQLLQRNAPICFGSGLNSYKKACYYEFDHYLSLLDRYFISYEKSALLFNKKLFRRSR